MTIWELHKTFNTSGGSEILGFYQTRESAMRAAELLLPQRNEWERSPDGAVHRVFVDKQESFAVEVRSREVQP